MTKRQEDFYRELAKEENKGKPLCKISEQVGFTPGTSRAGIHYAQLRRYGIKKGYLDKDKTEKDIKRAWRKVWKEGDNSNIHRNLELRTKCLGMTKETVKHEGDVPSNILINYGNAPQKVDKQDIATSKEDKQA